MAYLQTTSVNGSLTVSSNTAVGGNLFPSVNSSDVAVGKTNGTSSYQWLSVYTRNLYLNGVSIGRMTDGSATINGYISANLTSFSTTYSLTYCWKVYPNGLTLYVYGSSAIAADNYLSIPLARMIYAATGYTSVSYTIRNITTCQIKANNSGYGGLIALSTVGSTTKNPAGATYSGSSSASSATNATTSSYSLMMCNDAGAATGEFIEINLSCAE